MKKTKTVSASLAVLLTLSCFSSTVCAEDLKSDESYQTVEISVGEELKEDITEGDRMETYFSFNDGGWNTDPVLDKVSDGALVLTGGTPTRNVTHDVEPGYRYEIEFRLKLDKIGGECGFKYEFNGQRIFMQFMSDTTRVPVYGGGNNNVKIDDASVYHTYRMVVEGSLCDLYVDGEYLFTYTLPSRTNPAHNDMLSFFVNSSTVSIDYVLFRSTPAYITLVPPSSEIAYFDGSRATIKAICDGGAEDAPYVDYYANGSYIGTASREDGYALTWKNLRAGEYYLEARYGEYASETALLTVESSNTVTSVTVDKTEIAAGETVTFGLAKNVRTAKNVTYYVNGVALSGSIYNADTVGKLSVTAKIEYNDGSYAYADGAFINVSSENASVKLQSSYVAEYTADEGAKITASDGKYALDIAHSAEGVTYISSNGSETYNIGLGDYRVQVDGGICDVYYNGQFAFSFRMPVKATANGISAVGVSGLKLSGVNATLVTVTDNGEACRLPDISQKYAVEFVIEGKKDFALVVSDGAWETNLTATNGVATVYTYPNLENGVVETDQAFTLDDERHICRISVANGIGQIFIDNVWAHSFRLPKAFTVPYASAVGTGPVQIRETDDLYVYTDSFDGKGELDSEVYWSADADLIAEFTSGAMVLKPTESQDFASNIFSEDFDDANTKFSGDGFVIENGIMTVSNSDTTVSKNIIANVESSKDFILEVRARVTGFGSETGMKLEYPTNRIISYFTKNDFTVIGTDRHLKTEVDTTVWHTYKFVVTDTSKCELFIDGESRGTVNLMARNFSKNVIGFFSKPNAGGTTVMEIDSVKYTRNDAVPVRATRNIRTATIKAISLDPTVNATVKVNSAKEGSVYLTARYDTEYRNLLAGYSFDEGAWEIIRTVGTPTVLASVKGDFPFGKEVELMLTLDGDNVALYVNGKETVTTDKAKADHYGTVGVSLNTATVEVLDFSYEGASRPIPGAITFTNNAGSPDVFELEEGHIFVTAGVNNAYESTDDGLTWSFKNLGKYTNNTIVLSSGTVVYVKRTQVGEGENYVDYSYVSTDGGETFEGPYPIQSYVRNRITMNNKLTESTSGRLFFASGESGHGVEHEGGERIFYSDDEGRTWVGANLLALDGKTVISGDDEARLDIDNCGVNFQESKVVEMPDGTYRLYHRTDEGFLYYSISTDNGETWTTQMWTSEFPAVLSAFNIERDPYTGYYYMAWEYNVANDNATAQRPRTRVGLAVSYDGMETWEYVGDIHINQNYFDANSHYNIGLKPTKNAIYVDVVHATYIGAADGKESQTNYMVRIDKQSIKSTKRFTSLITLATTVPSPVKEVAINSALVVSPDGRDVLAGKKTYTVNAPVAGYVPASILAGYVGAVYQESGNTASMTLCSVDYSFTAGSAYATVNGKAVTMTAAPVMSADGLMLPITALRDVFARDLTTASNGSAVSLNKLLTRGSDVNAETMSAYLPIGVYGMNASEINSPDSWAVPEVDAANAEKIVPVTLNSAYRLAITREEFCELIMTMLNKKYGVESSKALVEKLGFKYENSFTDTDKTSIVAANCIGIVNGRGEGIFDPYSGITRQEAAVMLANAAKVLKISGKDAMEFTDMDSAAAWAKDSIEAVTSIVSETGARVMGGVGNGNFAPLGTYNREQAILTVYRLYMSK